MNEETNLFIFYGFIFYDFLWGDLFNSFGYQTNLSLNWGKKKGYFFPHYIFQVQFGLRTGIKVFYGEDHFF